MNMKMELTKEAYDHALEVLRKCSTTHGFFAASPGYDAVWSRDSMITSLGASVVGTKFKEPFKQSLITLATHQSIKGQIPNAVDTFSSREKHVDFKSIDSTLWFLIGQYLFKQRYKDNSVLKKHSKHIQKALTWLSYQDMGEDGMLEQLPTTDWQDAFPHRYGHTINTQALYYKVLCMAGMKHEAKRLNRAVNEDVQDGLWNGSFYLPWRWKNHNTYHERGEWFDSLGNMLAIVFDLASEHQAAAILHHVKKEGIDNPYPLKAIYPPILPGTKDWQDYYLDCDAGTPYSYLNGGIWTFIGGFYILALIKCKQYKEAAVQLNSLARANLKEGSLFPEWLDGKNGKFITKHFSVNQAWNAGMYVLAYQSIQKKKVLI